MIGKEISIRCKSNKPLRVGRVVKLSKQNWWQQFLIDIGWRLKRVEEVDPLNDDHNYYGLMKSGGDLVRWHQVHNIDTSAFKTGDILYLDPNNPGGFMTK